MSQEVSTDKASWQASMATTMRIHQCRGLCLRFMHIIDHMIACVKYWLSVLSDLFQCVPSPSGVPSDGFSPCGPSRHLADVQPFLVPCGGTFAHCVWTSVSCGDVPKALSPEGNVYPRVQVNGRGCVCGVRAVCKCVDA